MKPEIDVLLARAREIGHCPADAFPVLKFETRDFERLPSSSGDESNNWIRFVEFRFFDRGKAQDDRKGHNARSRTITVAVREKGRQQEEQWFESLTIDQTMKYVLSESPPGKATAMIQAECAADKPRCGCPCHAAGGVLCTGCVFRHSERESTSVEKPSDHFEASR